MVVVFVVFVETNSTINGKGVPSRVIGVNNITVRFIAIHVFDVFIWALNHSVGLVSIFQWFCRSYSCC